MYIYVWVVYLTFTNIKIINQAEFYELDFQIKTLNVMMLDNVAACCPAGGAVGRKEARTDPVRWARGRRIQWRQQEETLHCHRSYRGSACHIPGEEECLPSSQMCHWIMFCIKLFHHTAISCPCF